MDQHSGNGILEEFRIEFLDCWHRLPNKGFFLVLLAAWLALFQFLGNSTLGYIRTPSLMYWMFTAYNPSIQKSDADAAKETATPDTDDAYGNVVPLIVLGLFWLKRKDLLSANLRVWSAGLAFVLLGLALHFIGYMVQQPKISIIALFTGIYGLMGLAWGPEWLRRSFFPFFLFAFCVPLGSLAQPITFPLRLLVSRMVELISHYILAIDIIRVGTILKDPTGQYNYDVAAACSGIRSLFATLALAVVLAFVSMRTPWRRLLMIAAAFPLAIFGNLIRMLAIIIAADLGGRKLGDAVHEGGPGGIYVLLLYVPAFAGLLYLENRLRENRPAPDNPILQTTPA